MGFCGSIALEAGFTVDCGSRDEAGDGVLVGAAFAIMPLEGALTLVHFLTGPALEHFVEGNE